MQVHTNQNLWRSQSQPNVCQESAILQKRLNHQLGRHGSDSSLSSDWSSASSLDGGHLGNVVEAKIRSRSRGTYRVQGRHSRKTRSQSHLPPRSNMRSQSRDRSLDGIIRPEKNFILERWWATLGDIPATVNDAQCNGFEDLQHRTIKKDRHMKPFQNGKIKSLS